MEKWKKKLLAEEAQAQNIQSQARAGIGKKNHLDLKKLIFL